MRSNLDLTYTNIYEKGSQLFDDLGLGGDQTPENYTGDVEADLRNLWQSKFTNPSDRLTDTEIAGATRIINRYLENIRG